MKKYKIINNKPYNFPVVLKTLDGGSSVTVMVIKNGVMEILENQISGDLKTKEKNKLIRLVEIKPVVPQTPVELPITTPEVAEPEIPIFETPKYKKGKNK